MARKRLADLLREEAQKPAEQTESKLATDNPAAIAPTDPTSDTSSTSRAEKGTTAKNGTTRTSTAKRRTAQTVASKTAAPKTAVPKTAAPKTGVDASVSTSEKASTEQSQQEALHRLKSALTQAQQREASLHQQIADQQTELNAQTTLVQTLQADLQKTKPLIAELEKAKKTALQLAEENTRLQQTLATMQARSITASMQPTPVSAAPVSALPANLPAKGAALTKARTTPIPASTAILSKETLLERQTQALAHPMFPAGSMPGQLSDQDIGWVD